jgi:predicted nucleotidyltransferase
MGQNKMTISEQQLNTWASAPSPTEMQKIKNTRTVIEDVLKRKLPVDSIKRTFNLSSFTYEVYLQGSYANSTNVRFDSDVDIVVQLNSTFFPEKSQLTPSEKTLYDLSHSGSDYKFKNFKDAIFQALKSELTESQVHYGDKCIKVDGNTYRVKADVVPCLQYRLYKRFISHENQDFVEGMKFFDTSNDKEIINFPKIHLKNCESKNVDTEGKFKDTVRIFKNMRNKLVESGIIEENIAPSYFIENLLYNCSSPCFDDSYQNCMIKILQFIFDAIQTGRITGFICANEQNTLISEKTWNLNDIVTFMNKMAEYYLGEITL